MRTNAWDKLKESKHVHFRVGRLEIISPLLYLNIRIVSIKYKPTTD
jgi:hypothetical protein